MGYMANKRAAKGITGAVNPLLRKSKPILYSPGEGPAIPRPTVKKVVIKKK